LVYKMNFVFVDKNELQKISPVCVINATCRDFPQYIPSLLYGCLLYASLVTGYGCLWLRVSCHSNPECDVFWENVPKIIFAIMGGSKYFSDLFRPQFSEHVAQFQHSGAPYAWESWVRFQVDFFWTEYCLCSRCIIQKWLDKCNWNWTKSICQITRNHKQPYKREEVYRGKSLHACSLTHTGEIIYNSLILSTKTEFIL
jgi:hypothetical protein